MAGAAKDDPVPLMGAAWCPLSKAASRLLP